MVLLQAAQTALWAGILAVACTFCGFLWWSGTASYQEMSAPLAVGELDASASISLLATWGSLLLAILLTLLLRAVSPGTVHKDRVGLLQRVRRLLAWQLPPRAFLADWCGGLSLAEGLGICAYLGMNAFWLALGLERAFFPGDPWDAKLKAAAKLLGQMCAPNLMLLFLPIPHTNFITWLTGVSRNRLIRYHRWMGHATLWIVTAHSLCFYVYWAATNSFWANFSAWNDVGGVSNLAGSLAWFCGLALWASSLSFVRRRFYELFFRFHIACFLGFFLLSCAHYANCWLYFTPGLLLYSADLALRAAQMHNVTTVTAARVDEDSGTATLLLRADKALQHRPLSEVWLLLPVLSRWQWHPFSVASGGGNMLKLHVKRYGRFTKGLLTVLRRQQPLAVRLSGPMGAEVTGPPTCQLTPPPAWRRHDTCVMVCGGVGVTAMLSVLRAMAAERAERYGSPSGRTPAGGEEEEAAAGGKGAAPPLPSHVVVLWTARQAGEFLSLDRDLMMAARDPNGWLALHLFLTGGSPSRAPSAAPLPTNPRAVAPSPPNHSQRSRAPSSHHSLAFSRPQFVTQPLPAAAPGAAAVPVRMAGASAFGWSLLRPAQPLTFGTLQLAAVYVLTYFGALCAALVGTSYMQSAQGWQGGMVTCVLVSAVSVALPFTFAVWPVHWFRYLRAARRAKAEGAENELAAPYCDQGLLHEQSCALAGSSVVVPGEGLSLAMRRGRPDVEAILRSVAAETRAQTVGVFAGGPEGLMRAVHLTVCRLNGEAGGAYFELHNESVLL